jgi:hypothetical protein
MLYRGGNALADEAFGLGNSLADANQRADRAEGELEDLHGVVGNVHQSVLSLQHALGELATVTASVAAPTEPLAAAGESGVGEGDAAQPAAVEDTAAQAPGEGGALASVEAGAVEATVTPAAEPAPERAVAAQDSAAASESGALEATAPDVAAGPDEGSPSLFRRVTRGTRDKLRRLWPN